MAIITKLETEFAGPDIGTLPVLLHSAGIAGYSNRFVSKVLPGAADSLLSAWADSKTPAYTLTNSGGTARPAISLSADGTKLVKFDGVDDVLGTAAAALPAFRSFAVLFRTLAADGINTGILSANAGDLGTVRNTGNTLAAYMPGAAILNLGSTVMKGVKWTLLCGSWDGTNATLWAKDADGETRTATAASAGPVMSSLSVGLSTGNGWGNIEVAEILTYPGALTPANFSTIYDSLDAAYPFL